MAFIIKQHGQPAKALGHLPSNYCTQSHILQKSRQELALVSLNDLQDRPNKHATTLRQAKSNCPVLLFWNIIDHFWPPRNTACRYIIQCIGAHVENKYNVGIFSSV